MSYGIRRCELDDYLRGLTRRVYPTIRADEVRVVLVNAGERILTELETRQPRLQAWAQRFVTEHTGIELMLGRRVAAATPTDVVLDDGERVPSRTLISCAGTAQSPLLDTLPFERDQRGRVVTDDHVRVADSSSLNSVSGSLTLAAWVYRTTGQSGWRLVAGRQYGTTWDDQYFMGFLDNACRFGVHTTSGFPIVSGGVAPNAQWIHMAGTYDGSIVRLYVNGTQVSSSAASGAILSQAKPLIVGAGQNDGTAAVQEALAGRIDDFRLYKRALDLPASDVTARPEEWMAEDPDLLEQAEDALAAELGLAAGELLLDFPSRPDMLGVELPLRLRDGTVERLTDEGRAGQLGLPRIGPELYRSARRLRVFVARAVSRPLDGVAGLVELPAHEVAARLVGRKPPVKA